MAEEDRVEAAGMRSFWTGTITFGLVSVPVALYPATRPRSVSLRMVAPDGSPVERRYVCSKEGEALDDEEIVRGYEIEKGKFVIVTDEELEAIEPRKSREIDLRLFVDAVEIDPIYFERAYFLAPTGGSNKAYRLLAEVMERTGRAGVATFVMRAKEYIIAILAENGILRAETLRFHDEIRTPADVSLQEPKPADAAAVKRLEREIRKLEGEIDFSDVLDEYAERLERLVAAKRKKGEGVVEVSPESIEEEGGEVIDLLEVLSRSLAPSQGKRPERRGTASPSDALARQSKDALLERARELDIRGRSTMSKSELIEAIRRSA